MDYMTWKDGQRKLTAARRALIVGMFLIPVLMIFVIAAIPFHPLFQTAEFSTLEEVLTFIVTGGGALLIAGYVEAYLLENWTGWHTLPMWVKKLFPVIVAALIGTIAQSALVLGLLSYIPAGIKVIILAGAQWLFSQLAYKGIKEGGYGASTRAAADLPQG